VTAQEQTLVGLALVLRTTAGVHLAPEDITDHLARRCWAVALTLEQAGSPVTMSVLQPGANLDPQEVDQLQNWGMSAVTSLGASVEDLRSVAAVIAEAAFCRRAQNQILDALKTHTGRDLVLEVMARCQRLEASRDSDVVRVRDLIQQVLDEAEEVHRSGVECHSGVPTGLKALDSELTFGGWPRGRLSILAGKTSEGKSALATTCALGAMQSSCAVLCATLEDDAISALRRMLAAISGIDNRRVQRSAFEHSEWPAFVSASGQMTLCPLSFIERAATVEGLCSSIRSHALGEQTDLVIIDYLQLIRTTQGRSQQEKTDHVLGEIVNLAHGLRNTAMVLVSQLRRVGDNRPTKEDLYHSGAIEQWAHTIGILWRAPVRVPGCVTLLLEKQKQGPTGRVTLGWDAKTCSYTDPGPHEKQIYESAVAALKEPRR
jgi:replicative DNA helicase